MVYSNEYLFQQNFQKKLYHFNWNSQVESVMLKMMQLKFRTK